MKKDQIIMIRILSVVALLSVMALILVFGAGNGLFLNIINDINHNIVDTQSSAASIYNLYYYKGFNVVYMILFSITIYSIGISIVSILTRFDTAYLTAKISSTFILIMGVFILFARMMEGSRFMHRFIARFYINEVSSNVETAQLMSKVPFSAICLILLSILCIMLIRSSRIRTVKPYNYTDQRKVYAIYIPVLFGSVFIEYLREIIITARCNRIGSHMDQVNSFMHDYYFSNQWGFNWNYAWFLVIVAVVLIGLRLKLHGKNGKLLGLLITTGIPAIFVIIRSMFYAMNPPRLFGFLTFDEHVCDLTESAFVLYLIRFVLDIIVLTSVLEWLILKKEEIIKILISYGANVVISICGILIFGNIFGIAGMYVSCIIANIITLVSNFYIFYIGRSHH